MSLYANVPAVSIRRYGNGWIYTVSGMHEEHQGVMDDSAPLKLSMYVPGLGRYADLTLALREEDK
jgi:hypothetical protein